MTTFVNNNSKNMDYALASPAYKVRKVVRANNNNNNRNSNDKEPSSQTGSYQNVLAYSTGSRIVGIPKHLRLKMQREKKEETLRQEKNDGVEADDNKPYNVSQSSYTSNITRRVMPPHRPLQYAHRQHLSSSSISASNSALTPSRYNRRPGLNKNKRTRTGLSPALRALGVNEGIHSNQRLQNKLPPSLNLDGIMDNSDDQEGDKLLGGHTNTVDDSSSDEEIEDEEDLPDAEDALNPMMLNNNQLDSDNEDEEDNEAVTDEDNNLVFTPSLSQSPITDDFNEEEENDMKNNDDDDNEKNGNVSFIFRRSSVESATGMGVGIDDGDLNTGMTRSTSWSHLVSPMLSPSEGPSILTSKSRTMSTTSFVSAGDMYDDVVDDGFTNDIDNDAEFVELEL